MKPPGGGSSVLVVLRPPALPVSVGVGATGTAGTLEPARFVADTPATCGFGAGFGAAAPPSA